MLVTAADAATDAARRSNAILDQMIAAARPGTRMSQLHSIATKGLQPLALHPMLGGSVGRGIGLSLHEGPAFRDNENTALAHGGVYALQVGVADPRAGCALKSAIVHIREGEPEILTRSPAGSPDDD